MISQSSRHFPFHTEERGRRLKSLCELAGRLKAVQMAEALRPTLAVLEVALPKLNRLEAAGWIRKLAPESRLVFVSERYPDSDVIKAALHLGLSYVLKSDAAGDMIAAIHAAAQGCKYRSKLLMSFRVMESVD